MAASQVGGADLGMLTHHCAGVSESKAWRPEKVFQIVLRESTDSQAGEHACTLESRKSVSLVGPVIDLCSL